MDWWLFWGPIIGSALGGAVVTGIVTVFFGVWKQGRGRQEGHRRGVRVKRHGAGAALIADALSVHTSLPLADPDSVRGLEAVLEKAAFPSYGSVRLVGSVEAAACARAVRDSVYEFARTFLSEYESNRVKMAARESASGALMDNLSKFGDLCEEELRKPIDRDPERLSGHRTIPNVR